MVRKYAHSSCIKGLVASKLTAESGGDDGSCVRVHSSGYDQRFKTWTVKLAYGEQGRPKLAAFEKNEPQHTNRHCLSDMNGMCKAGESIYLVG